MEDSAKSSSVHETSGKVPHVFASSHIYRDPYPNAHLTTFGLINMCGKNGKKDELEVKPSTELSPFDDDINQIFDRVGNFTNQLADFTKKVVGQTHNFAKNYDFPSWMSESKGEKESFMNRPYQERDPDLFFGKHPFETFDPFNFFSDFKRRTPFGIRSHGQPSVREYNDCLRKDGESLWDSNGYWRCLFPNKEVPVALLDYKKAHLSNEILTKEDFTDAAKESSGKNVVDLGPKGVFFKQFNDYLNWKNSEYESVRKRREEAIKKANEEREHWKQLHDSQSQSMTTLGNDSLKKAVVSLSVQTSMDTDTDKNETVLREVRTQVFDDGTFTTTNITKSKPIGSKEWTNVKEDTHEDSKKGWFWNK